MTDPQPEPPRHPVETKVAAATTTVLVLSALAAVLTAAQEDPRLLGGLPGWAQAVLVLLVPPLATFLAGYQAPHTRRGDDPDDNDDT